jgi:putative transposase
MMKNTDYVKSNAYAFYSINGNNFINFMESSKAENVCEFLEKIVEHNQKKKIILVLDNSKSHHADKTVRKARDFEILNLFLLKTLIFLIIRAL